MDKFTQLVEDLDKGNLSLTHMQNAYREHIRHSELIPDAAKSILCGESEYSSGLIVKYFNLLSQTVGSMELLARRLGWSKNKKK